MLLSAQVLAEVAAPFCTGGCSRCRHGSARGEVGAEQGTSASWWTTRFADFDQLSPDPFSPQLRLNKRRAVRPDPGDARNLLDQRDLPKISGYGRSVLIGILRLLGGSDPECRRIAEVSCLFHC